MPWCPPSIRVVPVPKRTPYADLKPIGASRAGEARRRSAGRRIAEMHMSIRAKAGTARQRSQGDIERAGVECPARAEFRRAAREPHRLLAGSNTPPTHM